MIKNITLTLTTALLLVGCGGGDTGNTTSSSTIGTQNTTLKAYNLWDYMVPTQSKTNTFTLNQNGTISHYTSNYTVQDNYVEEVASYAPSEKTTYQKDADAIVVKFQKDNKANGMYELVLSADVGDVVTKRSSSCKLNMHHDSIEVAGKSFQDVLEIRCGNLPGYYQKGVGEVAQLEDTTGKNTRVLSN